MSCYVFVCGNEIKRVWRLNEGSSPSISGSWGELLFLLDGNTQTLKFVSIWYPTEDGSNYAYESNCNF